MAITDLKSNNGSTIADYFSNKTLDELEVAELAYIHLNGAATLSNYKVTSSLNDLMQTAQASLNNHRTRIYTPLLAYFAILDQIGGAYTSTLKKTDYGSGIKAALDIFSDYSKEDLSKLYSLRNGLYHDGSLVNVDTAKSNKANVIFRLTSETDKTIIHPHTEWDGIYHDDLTQYVTKINTKLLKRDMETIVERCAAELLEVTLEMKITCPREFFYKFLFTQ